MTRRLSISTRLTLIAMLAVTTIAVLVAGLAWLALRQSLTSQVDAQLETMLRGPIGELDASTVAAIPATPLIPPITIRIQILQTDGQTVTAPPGNPRLPVSGADRTVLTGQSRQARYTLDSGEGHFRVLTGRGAQGQTIQLARSLADVDATLRTAGTLMILLVAGAAIAAAIAGRVVAVTGLRPIHRITRAATQIASTRELVRPIPADGTDEVAQLGHAFNQMIAALDHAQQSQRELIEDAAHELRTPMSSMRTNLELLIHAEARLSVADRQDLLTDLHKQGVELSNLVTDVVDLARSKTADRAAEPVDLVGVAADAIDRARIRSQNVRLELHGLPSLTVDAQPAVIERAVVNLLDNAVKFGPADQTVVVRVTLDEAGQERFAEISVADRAPTIPAADRERIFRRFHRLDTGRGVSGSGLGLAIVHQAAIAHGGSVTVEPRPGGGNVFRLRLRS
jgi:two-component system sensor histidine kinase MprB